MATKVNSVPVPTVIEVDPFVCVIGKTWLVDILTVKQSALQINRRYSVHA